jgi:hypothetical protein
MAIYISNEWFVGFLLFLLIYLLASTAIKKVLHERAQIIIISLIISILAVYYMTSSQIDFISWTYTLAGTLILIFIPFLIALFFIYSVGIGDFVRKAFWIFFFGLAFILVQKANLDQRLISNLSLGIIICGLIIIIFDKKIKSFFNARKNLKKY